MVVQTQHIAINSISQHDADLLVVLVPAGQSGFAGNDYCSGLTQAVQHYINIADWHSKSEHLLCLNPPFLKTSKLLLVNTNNKVSANASIQISECIVSTLKRINPSQAHIVLPPWYDEQEAFINALYHASYQFEDYKSQQPPRLDFTLTLLVGDDQLDPVLRYADALHKGKSLTRDLANMPGNLCTPAYFAECAQKLDNQYASISTDVLDEDQLSALAMGAYLAVGRASAQPSCMPVIRYTGTTADVPAIWVIGKGITFDTGGITLKKPPGMQNMIYDMCGGATVIGLMTAVAELKLPINITGVIATAENMPDGDAFRPGDIITSMSGQTVEIISTDAEGRLVLCDAITYAKQHDPALIIDVATLTGAQIVSLGTHASGLMGNCPSLNMALEQAGEQSGDRTWTMPLWPDYQDALDSPFADMCNAGNNSPGMITAGCYLARFAGDTPWAHLDIAGTGFKYGTGNSASGRPLPMLLQFLRNFSNLSDIEWSINLDANHFLP